MNRNAVLGAAVLYAFGNLMVTLPASAQDCPGWVRRMVDPPTGASADPMAYDIARAQTIMFVPAPKHEDSNTWGWNGGEWLLLANNFEDGGPDAFLGHTMVFDSLRNVIVVHGGANRAGNSISDTWEWDGQTWSWRAFGGGDRTYSAMAFDSIRGISVVFGGYYEDEHSFFTLGDTWEWDGMKWSEVAESGPPDAAFGWLAFDPERGVCVIGPYGDGKTWEWDGKAWSFKQVPGPGPRGRAAMVYSPDLHACVLFGGTKEFGVRDDMWMWNGTEWKELHPAVRPSPRRSHGMAYDSARHAIVLFGGIDAKGKHLTDTWEYLCAPPCYPDLDGSGSLDLFDFLAFTNLFNASDPKADCDKNGDFDLFDFLCFVNAFNTGC